MSQDTRHTDNQSIGDLLAAAGLTTLGDVAAPDAVEEAVRAAAAQLNGADPLRREAARAAIVVIVRRHGWRAGAVDEVLRQPAAEADAVGGGRPYVVVDVAPDDDPQDGAQLLDDVAAWIRRYVWLPAEAADAIALWAVLTWCVGSVYFAPLLCLQSATRRCGKTLVLDLLAQLVRRPLLTSGGGVTPAVVFRLTDQHQTALLLDEAEKLASVEDGREIIGLLNAGYRRGATVQRCHPLTLEILNFNAFGFRGLAAIKPPADTLLDRAIIVRMQRRPRHDPAAQVARFHARDVEHDGRALARRLARWTADVMDRVAPAEATAPRPDCLHDRAADHWAGLFALAALAGGEWPARALAAAKALAGEADDGDAGSERLLRDVADVFRAAGWPEVLASGELAKRLNELSEAPWADKRAGKGLSTHTLAAALRPFGVGPRPDKSGGLRGYRLTSLGPIWARYDIPGPPDPPHEVSKRQISHNDASFDANRSVKGREPSDTSKPADIPHGCAVSDGLTLWQGVPDGPDVSPPVPGPSGPAHDYRCAGGCGRAVGSPGTKCPICTYGPP